VTISPLRILSGLILGLVAGSLLALADAGVRDHALAVAAPVGRLWLDALTMTVVPLVFGLLVTGVASASATAASGAIARRAMLWFAVLLVVACTIGAAVASGVLALIPVPSAAFAAAAVPSEAVPIANGGDWLAGLIPTNPIKAAAETAMVQIVIFALLFGFALTRIAAELRDTMIALFRGLVEAMLVIVGWVLWLAPLGVFALAVGVGARLGLGAAGTLLHYALLVAFVCFTIVLFSYVLAAVAGGLSPLRFARAALPSQAVALSTQSSLASLPAMIGAGERLGVAREVPAIVLPLAVSIFRMSSAAANIAVTIYLAHVHHVPLGPQAFVTAVLVGAAVSVAAVGLPAQVSFFATIAPVCVAIGVPVELLPVLLAVETIPDIGRTLGNVSCDLAVTRIVGRGSAAAEA
jgi:Na+/H+-dicarboxylate symporter